MDEGIRTVILGKPNVGKSSLLNCLTGTEKAIVTDIPGTTRDLLEETIVMKGFSLRIIDTAGIRDSSNPVEKIGIERAREQAEEADLILYIADATDVLDDEDKEILELTRGKKAIFLINKTDLLEKTFEKNSGDARENTFEGSFEKARKNDFEGSFEKAHKNTFEGSFEKACENTGSLAIRREEAEKLVSCPIIEISAKEGTGMDTLKDTIENMFFKGEISFNDEVYITSMRHKTLLEEADTALTNVCSSIDDGMPEDFFSIDLMGAVKALDGITGGDISEELADEIFSKFCMGK
jgi:tRNA modification GTPase